MKKILYFDCLAGISGDMTIGALLDLGIDQDAFLARLKSLDLDGYELKIEKKLSSHISCTDFDVIIAGQRNPKHHHHDPVNQDHQHHHHHSHGDQDHHHHSHEAPHSDQSRPSQGHHHRNLKDIHQIIERSDIPTDAKELSKRIFQTIGEAEAAIHQKTIDEIHFHEVGAIDSIIDIVGAAVAISMLEVDEIIASPLHVGTGTVTCAHGILPVPAPATARILKGIPVYSTGIRSELVTPTGAAIIKNLATSFEPLPQMIIEEIGYGSGKKETGMANLLRVFLGNSEPIPPKKNEHVSVIETNIDDMNPEVYSYLVPKILNLGALDVFLTHIVMKKERPGVKITILCRPEQDDLFEETLLRETTTLGIRKYRVERNCLERKVISVDTPLGAVDIKQAFRDGRLVKSAPEYESCRKLAEEKNLPINDVYQVVSQSLGSRGE